MLVVLNTFDTREIFQCKDINIACNKFITNATFEILNQLIDKKNPVYSTAINESKISQIKIL